MTHEREKRSKRFTEDSRHGPRRKTTLRPALLAMLGCLVAPATQASLLLTEIHYNGPAPGSDPDEFLEFANSGTTAIALAGYHLTDAIDFSFAEDDVLGAGASLVLARDLAGFSAAFPAYDGALYGFSGALSNSGETLTLTLDGTAVWSISYDDSGSWPREADGGGASLQLLPGAVDYNDPASWTAAAPDPGSWAGLAGTPGRRPVPAPATLWLIAGALPLVLRRVRRHRRRSATTGFASARRAGVDVESAPRPRRTSPVSEAVLHRPPANTRPQPGPACLRTALSRYDGRAQRQ